ncbi:hypothetical protein ONS95_009425 [Cadophora gregata]|uniref:uncharacterized protein n=1 Tax=Cadophora gregata TaxID=51156 RepID=UPI0026DADA7E|nr:uncharacterized protein ONS95_009425 [Cadophora gregata]KAK0124473.1 hypothetical protein ONS95_009425 [Cadophora gregata]KAK0129674.1 hypothetical protein ONS96_000237 [Cadophora gregata f. sp. sojae]
MATSTKERLIADVGNEDRHEDPYLFDLTSYFRITPWEQSSSTDGQETVSDEPEFTLFPSLPIELRLRIWRYAQPEPHVVDIIFNEKSPDKSMSTAAPPVLLFVCRESRAETLKIYKLLSRSMKSSATDLYRRIYINPLVDTLHFADDWRTASQDLTAYIPLESIVSWLNEDLIKTQKHLALGLAMLDANIQAASHPTAFSAMAKFQALESLMAVISPKRRQRCANEIVDPYGLRRPTPPLLAPDEDARFAIYLSPDVRYAKPVSEGGDPYYTEIDEVLNLQGGEDRMQELEDLLEEMQDELEAVYIDHPKWRMPYTGVAALH